MKIFVTGGTGFIGSYLINALNKLGHDVVALKRSGSKPRIILNKQPKWIIGKIGYGNLKKLPNCDIVIHLAASGVKASNRNWYDCINTNIIGTNELLIGLSGVPNPPLLIYLRTFYEEYLNKVTSFKRNPYIVTKTTATKIIESWAQKNINAKVVFGTVFQAYGPGDEYGNLLTYTKRCLQNNIKAKLGSGSGLRDWIYINDLVDALAKTIDLKHNRIQYYDFGTGSLTSIKKMVETLAELMYAPNSLLDFDHNRDRGDTEFGAYAKNLVPDWYPSFSVREGLELLIKNI